MKKSNVKKLLNINPYYSGIPMINGFIKSIINVKPELQIDLNQISEIFKKTIMYELRRSTGKRKGSRGRFPEYSAKRGQANYEMNRSLCHRKAKALNCNPFVDWVVDEVLNKKGSIDSCVGSAKLPNK